MAANEGEVDRYEGVAMELELNGVVKWRFWWLLSISYCDCCGTRSVSGYGLLWPRPDTSLSSQGRRGERWRLRLYEPKSVDMFQSLQYLGPFVVDPK